MGIPRFLRIRETPHFLLNILVGGFNPSEKYELVSWDDYMEIKKCSKPPTSS
jgi:hypothetical protein